MSKKVDQIMGHGADNDGIEEYDNDLPGWWVAMFVFCVLWGIGYSIDYHFISQRSQAASYEAEMAAAAEKWPKKEVGEVKVTKASVEAGKAVYDANCVACHAADMTGGIGPNLTDAEWIHGGDLPSIINTVTNGVPAKGMLAWGPILGDEKIAQVATYIFENTDKSGAKPKDE